MSHRYRSHCCCGPGETGPTGPEPPITQECHLGFGKPPKKRFDPSLRFGSSTNLGARGDSCYPDFNMYTNSYGGNIHDNHDYCFHDVNSELIVTVERIANGDVSWSGAYEFPDIYDPPAGLDFCSRIENSGIPRASYWSYSNRPMYTRYGRLKKKAADPSGVFDPKPRDWSIHPGRPDERPYIWRPYGYGIYRPIQVGGGAQGGFDPEHQSNDSRYPLYINPFAGDLGPDDLFHPHGTANYELSTYGNCTRDTTFWSGCDDMLGVQQQTAWNWFWGEAVSEMRSCLDRPFTLPQGMIIGHPFNDGVKVSGRGAGWDTSYHGFVPPNAQNVLGCGHDDCPPEPEPGEDWPPRPTMWTSREWGGSYFWLQGIHDFDFYPTYDVETGEEIYESNQKYFRNFISIPGAVEPFSGISNLLQAFKGSQGCDAAPYGLWKLGETIMGVVHRETHWISYWNGRYRSSFDGLGDGAGGQSAHTMPVGDAIADAYFVRDGNRDTPIPNDTDANPSMIKYQCAGVPVFSWEPWYLLQEEANRDVADGLSEQEKVLAFNRGEISRVPDTILLQMFGGSNRIDRTYLDQISNYFLDTSAIKQATDEVKSYTDASASGIRKFVTALIYYSFQYSVDLPWQVSDLMERGGILPPPVNHGPEHDYKIFKKKMYFHDPGGDTDPEVGSCCFNAWPKERPSASYEDVGPVGLGNLSIPWITNISAPEPNEEGDDDPDDQGDPGTDSRPTGVDRRLLLGYTLGQDPDSGEPPENPASPYCDIYPGFCDKSGCMIEEWELAVSRGFTYTHPETDTFGTPDPLAGLTFLYVMGELVQSDRWELDGVGGHRPDRYQCSDKWVDPDAGGNDPANYVPEWKGYELAADLACTPQGVLFSFWNSSTSGEGNIYRFPVDALLSNGSIDLDRAELPVDDPLDGEGGYFNFAFFAVDILQGGWESLDNNPYALSTVDFDGDPQTAPEIRPSYNLNSTTGEPTNQASPSLHNVVRHLRDMSMSRSMCIETTRDECRRNLGGQWSAGSECPRVPTPEWWEGTDEEWHQFLISGDFYPPLLDIGLQKHCSGPSGSSFGSCCCVDRVVGGGIAGGELLYLNCIETEKDGCDRDRCIFESPGCFDPTSTPAFEPCGDLTVNSSQGPLTFSTAPGEKGGYSFVDEAQGNDSEARFQAIHFEDSVTDTVPFQDFRSSAVFESLTNCEFGGAICKLSSGGWEDWVNNTINLPDDGTNPGACPSWRNVKTRHFYFYGKEGGWGQMCNLSTSFDPDNPGVPSTITRPVAILLHPDWDYSGSGCTIPVPWPVETRYNASNPLPEDCCETPAPGNWCVGALFTYCNNVSPTNYGGDDEIDEPGQDPGEPEAPEGALGIPLTCASYGSAQTCRGVWWQHQSNDYSNTSVEGGGNSKNAGCDFVNNCFWLVQNPYEIGTSHTFKVGVHDGVCTVGVWYDNPATGTETFVGGGPGSPGQVMRGFRNRICFDELAETLAEISQSDGVLPEGGGCPSGGNPENDPSGLYPVFLTREFIETYCQWVDLFGNESGPIKFTGTLADEEAGYNILFKQGSTAAISAEGLTLSFDPSQMKLRIFGQKLDGDGWKTLTSTERWEYVPDTNTCYDYNPFEQLDRLPQSKNSGDLFPNVFIEVKEVVNNGEPYNARPEEWGCLDCRENGVDIGYVYPCPEHRDLVREDGTVFTLRQCEGDYKDAGETILLGRCPGCQWSGEGGFRIQFSLEDLLKHGPDFGISQETISSNIPPRFRPVDDLDDYYGNSVEADPEYTPYGCSEFNRIKYSGLAARVTEYQWYHPPYVYHDDAGGKTNPATTYVCEAGGPSCSSTCNQSSYVYPWGQCENSLCSTWGTIRYNGRKKGPAGSQKSILDPIYPPRPD